MTKDWRLEHLETQLYLRGVSFMRKPYRAYRRDWEHDRCVAGWKTFEEPGGSNPHAVHEGYATTESFVRGADYEWVCVSCFDDFTERMGWVEETRGASAG
jgi:hypothetical protein